MHSVVGDGDRRDVAGRRRRSVHAEQRVSDEPQAEQKQDGGHPLAGFVEVARHVDERLLPGLLLGGLMPARMRVLECVCHGI